MLERYGIVRVQRGIDGGLRAIRPDPVSVIKATSLFLAPAYAERPRSFHRLSLALQLEAATEITKRSSVHLIPDLEAYQKDLVESPERSTRSEVFSYYDFLARACGNPVLECLMRSMVFQVDFAVDKLADDELDTLRQWQIQLADAVKAGDSALCRRLAIQLRNAGFSHQPVPRESVKMLDAV
jgi:DNA-binding FadR family transcriptional regulator